MSGRAHQGNVDFYQIDVTRRNPVISTEHEGAKRLKGSGEIGRLCPPRCRCEVFYPRSVCLVLKRTKTLLYIGIIGFIGHK